ncbi:MAG TPA: DUF4382 domain-containing protein [Candidatus Polarisedimenticolaceae bacterium]|nr:DUF4382 domain-containing protein [Candidatus Polarisedimenticolaceae bacterium]
MKKRISILALLVALCLGCASDPTAPENGTVAVLLTDAPIDLSTVSAVEVTLDRIVLFAEDGMVEDQQGMEMEQPGVAGGAGMTLNLLDYQNGQTVLIATLEVPAGQYQKIRMYVRNAELVETDPADGTTEIRHEITVPSSKVDVPVAFTVSGGESTEVVLDFDAALSVQVNETAGNPEYILRPVITPTGVTG